MPNQGLINTARDRNTPTNSFNWNIFRFYNSNSDWKTSDIVRMMKSLAVKFKDFYRNVIL